eukprot:g20565.t1
MFDLLGLPGLWLTGQLSLVLFDGGPEAAPHRWKRPLCYANYGLDPSLGTAIVDSSGPCGQSPFLASRFFQYTMAEKDGDGDKDKKKEPKGEERSWSGVSSVWEFQASMVEPSSEEFYLPPCQGGDIISREVPKYLEDATLGLRGGPGDSKKAGDASPQRCLGPKMCCLGSHSRMPEPRTDNARRVGELRRFLANDSALRIASSLFWLALSAIFHCVPDQVVQVSRTLLGRSWHSFQLEVGDAHDGLFHDLPTRQWVLSSVPFIFSQVIFRMYFDGFPEDRHEFTADAVRMGFQINLDTARKLRSNLFLRRVVDSPHVNQTDFLAGQRRQAELEQQNYHTRPLKFGHLDAPRPDEIQLEHVLQARADRRDGKSNWLSASVSLSPQSKKDLVPTELSALEKIRRLGSVFAGDDLEDDLEEPMMKRHRQQLLEQKLKAETLPARFCKTELNTTWVSPGMLSIEEERHLHNLHMT